MTSKHLPLIVVFDSKCLLCNSWVQFLLKHDKSGTIRFASMQGETGRKLLLEHRLPLDNLETLLVLQGALAWTHTAAILKVLSTLGWPWKAVNAARVLPAPIRDRVYRMIARNRYRLFGEVDQCMVPDPKQAYRFLD